MKVTAQVNPKHEVTGVLPERPVALHEQPRARQQRFQFNSTGGGLLPRPHQLGLDQPADHGICRQLQRQARQRRRAPTADFDRHRTAAHHPPERLRQCRHAGRHRQPGSAGQPAVDRVVRFPHDGDSRRPHVLQDRLGRRPRVQGWHVGGPEPGARDDARKYVNDGFYLQEDRYVNGVDPSAGYFPFHLRYRLPANGAGDQRARQRDGLLRAGRLVAEPAPDHQRRRAHRHQPALRRAPRHSTG